jgi:hypothetical protein
VELAPPWSDALILAHGVALTYTVPLKTAPWCWDGRSTPPREMCHLPGPSRAWEVVTVGPAKVTSGRSAAIRSFDTYRQHLTSVTSLPKLLGTAYATLLTVWQGAHCSSNRG